MPVDCDDQNPCTINRCNPTTGACEHLPVNCDDGNECTKDFCDPASGVCRHDPQFGAPRNDGDACTQDDKCVQSPLGGVVCHGTPLSCDDSNPCTADTCNPLTGVCEHRPIPVLEPDPIRFRGQVTIFWGATPDATHWNTYRGTIPAKMLGSRLPGSVYDQACYESDDSGANGPTIAIDGANPPLGTAFYYLVNGENVCGESIIGQPSAPPGGIIPNTLPCPTPPLGTV